MLRFVLRLRVKPELCAYAVLFLAYVLRLEYWREQWNAPLIISGDEGIYYNGAVVLARDITALWNSDAWHLWHSHWLEPPLYPFALSVLVRFLGEDPLALRAFQVLLGVLTIALVYRMGRTLFSQWVGVGAALFVAILAPLVQLSVLLLSENLFIVLLVGGFVGLIEFGRLASDGQTGAFSRTSQFLRLLFVAGLLLALATLTRSNASLFLVVIGLWIVSHAHSKWRTALLFLLWYMFGAGLVFIPWTVRNYMSYQRLLLTDTMGGYNIALANGIDDARFAQIPNPVDRQSAALRAGLEQVFAHPASAVQAIIPNMQHLLRLDETYHMLGFQNPDPLNASAGALILDDGVMLVVLLLSIVGFVYIRDWRLNSLLLLWVGYSFVLLTVIFYSVIRYRWPLMPFLAPGAVYGIEALRTRAFKFFPAWRNGLALVGCLLALWLMLGDYPARTAQVIRRENALAAASGAEQRGQMTMAAQDLQQAQALDPRSTRVQIAWGDYYRALGDSQNAAAAYHRAIDLNDDSLVASTRLVDLYRMLGETTLAERIVGAPGEDDAPLLERAWAHPESLASIPSRVDVGALDVGYVHWMFPRETITDDTGDLTFRWTSSSSQIRLRAPSPTARVLSLRLNAFRPEGVPRPKLTIAIDGREIKTFVVRPIWQNYHVILPSDLDLLQPFVVTLHCDVWIAKAEGQIIPPPPRLGVQLDWIQLGENKTQE